LNHHSPHESGYHFRWSITHLQTQISPDLKTGWWFGTWLLFFHHIGNVIIPTDEFIFLRGVETINHIYIYIISLSENG
jgi:hypothetical protein